MTWINWPGGECPVGENVVVEVRFRCGDEDGVQPASFWSGWPSDWWKHEGHDRGSDIIAYRIPDPQP